MNKTLSAADVEGFKKHASGLVTDCRFYQNIDSYVGRSKEELLDDIRRETRNMALIHSIAILPIIFSWEDRAHYLKEHGVESRLGPLFERIDQAFESIAKTMSRKKNEADEDKGK